MPAFNGGDGEEVWRIGGVYWPFSGGQINRPNRSPHRGASNADTSPSDNGYDTGCGRYKVLPRPSHNHSAGANRNRSSAAANSYIPDARSRRNSLLLQQVQRLAAGLAR